jgi:TonB family protein
MSAHEANNPFDLLRLMPPPPPPVSLHGAAEPQLAIGWGEFHQGVFSNFVELFRFVRVPKNFLLNNPFKDSWIERPLPRRAVLAAALWHVAFVLLLPLQLIFSAPKRNPAFANTEITWSGPIEDFPLVELPAAKPKTLHRTTAGSTADAFHPRQRIFTDPVHPNHPRQTLIQTKAPLVAPQVLPDLPNMVQLAQSVGPARPRLQISQKFLKQLHPRQKRVAADPNAPAPEMTAADQRVSDLALTASNAGPERPRLQINAGAAPRPAQRRQDGAAESAPDVAAQLTSANGGPQTLIALSAAPGPPAPIAPPPGNLAARVSISPEGKKNGSGESSPGSSTASGTSPVGVSISGGAPKASSTISGLGGAAKLSMPSARPNYARADAAHAADEPEVRSGAPNFAALPPDARPEAIFARRRVYSLNVNMPNLNSATGSWILNFTELRAAPTGPQSGLGELAEPSPLHKVDPKYPPTAIAEHIEGEVILYAVIRRDGSVDSIQLVKGIDDQLDANAMHALAQWKFHPAERNGEPVDLEAIVHIPFRAPSRQ